jgi:hypothetical protein
LTPLSLAQQNLAARQNSDGGWPYARGVSWTEPTVYALMALLDAGDSEAVRRGFRWLRIAQRSDGGWPPQTGVDESTWVTALVALLPPEQFGDAVHEKAVNWVAGSSAEESGPIFRLRQWLLGQSSLSSNQAPGWPWIPNTAAWVAPTSIAVLALQKESRRDSRSDLQKRLDEGRNFLLQRMCKGGGWNHGSTTPLGYPTTPYPETTGMALTALHGVHARQIDVSLPLAQRYLSECRSADAWNWLRLGLLAQGRLPAHAAPAAELQFRSVPEVSLDLILQAAFEGRNRLFAA